MKLKWLVVGLVPAAIAMSCSADEAQQVVPETRGQRGETCEARNDCEAGLACLSGICSKNDFDISPTAKHCDRVDCQATEDCCGGRPTEAPEKCANFNSICFVSTLPDCFGNSCTTDDACGGGVCAQGSCSTFGGLCTTSADCVDTCDLSVSLCTMSSLGCLDDTYCYGALECFGRYCDCTNPEYDPLDPICTDSDCTEPLCTKRCVEERCVDDTSCETAADCFAFGLAYCDDGRCVACLDDEDCDDTLEEACVDGACKKPCTQNEECPYFHQCQAGECIYTGCSSDRECIFAAGQGLVSADDARLAKCLPSDEDADLNTCKVPCENDGACGSEFEVCEGGYCKFVGCETDEECRTYLQLNDESTEGLPYTPQALCRE